MEKSTRVGRMPCITTPPIVVSGAGLSALMLGRMIRENCGDRRPIIFVEQDLKIGGQFSSFDYGSEGLFDQGMHIYYESSIKRIDDLFTNILPIADWNILEGNRKDIAGLFYNGRLQTETPYVDLRHTDSVFRKRCISELFLHLEEVSGNREKFEKKQFESAYETSVYQFGHFISDQVFVPVFQKLYQTHPSKLDKLAHHLTTVNRVALFDEGLALELMRSELFRARLAFPDQLRLPPIRQTSQRGFYPKRFGMARVMQRFREILEEENCFFLTNSRISSINLDGSSRIAELTIETSGFEARSLPIDQLFWTSGVPSIAATLGIPTQDLPNDPNNKKLYYVNLRTSVQPRMYDLYYFYCFDTGFRTFRVTNFAGYCPNAVCDTGYPLCVEMWMQDGDDISPESVQDRAVRELVKFQVLPDESVVVSARVEKTSGGGFPLPSLNNVRFLNVVRDRIAERSITNLEIFGVYSSPDTFFIKDILIDADRKLRRWY